MEEKKWYAIKAIYGRALKAQALLSGLGIDSYVPTKAEVSYRGTKREKVVKRTPVITNLIFIYTENQTIRELVRSYDWLHHLYQKEAGKSLPSIVPADQMDRFIAFVSQREESVVYVDLSDVDFTKGERVRITSGPFAGREGVLARVNGKRSKQVVVAIEGYLAAMMTEIDKSEIERI